MDGGLVTFGSFHVMQHVGIVLVEAQTRQMAVVEVELELSVVLGEYNVGYDGSGTVVVFACPCRFGIEVTYDVGVNCDLSQSSAAHIPGPDSVPIGQKRSLFLWWRELSFSSLFFITT